MLTTPQGTIRQGKVEFETPIELPEGSQVFVIPSPTVDEQTACRKANAWLMRHIGQVGTRKQGDLSLIDGVLTWRFEAFVSNIGTPPLGPLGSVAIDANTGQVLNPEQTITTLKSHLDHLTPHP